MDSSAHVVFNAKDRSYFSIIKKEIHALAAEAGFEGTRLGNIDIIVSELLTNLVKHAGGGELWLKPCRENNQVWLEIIAVDNGPGIPDVLQMSRDGVSTKQTLGLGLGSLKRLSDVFHLYTMKDWGTIMLCRVFTEDEPPHRKPPAADIKSVVLPKPGEVACGDAFFTWSDSRYIRCFLADGLGHGVEAADAALKAGESFRQCTDANPVEVIRYINDRVRKTRGLVGTVSIFDKQRRVWSLCGVGNVSTRIIHPLGHRNYMPYNGIIGLNVPRTLNAQETVYEKGQALVMCSDGLRSKWDFTKYNAIFRNDPTIICSALLKDFGRQTDDMSVGICKINL